MSAHINNICMNLYNNKNDDADVIFVVHGQEVKAHKCIVTDRSEFLKAMLNSDLAPSDGRHLIADPNIRAEDFKQFLKFLYLGEFDLSSDNIGALLHISDVYLLPSMKERCLEYIRNRCKTLDGIFECCELGILYENECPELLKLCFDELSRNKVFCSFKYAARINQVSTELFEKIAQECPRSQRLTEDKLFVKIFEWGKQKCVQNKIPANAKNIKRILSPVVKHIKFESVCIHSWVNIIFPNKLAPQEECYKMFTDFAKYCVRDTLQITPAMLKEISSTHEKLLSPVLLLSDEDDDSDEDAPTPPPRTQTLRRFSLLLSDDDISNGGAPLPQPVINRFLSRR